MDVGRSPIPSQHFGASFREVGVFFCFCVCVCASPVTQDLVVFLYADVRDVLLQGAWEASLSGW